MAGRAYLCGMAKLEVLQKSWIELAHRVAPGKTNWAAKVWRELQKHYGHKSRHYHNFDHLAAMLTLIDQHENQLDRPDLLRLAVWFHDIIYRFTAKDNEEKSAVRALERLSEIDFPKEEAEVVNELILRTKDHFQVRDDESSDLQFFLDCDLGILGVGEEAYGRYMKAIRKEYRLVPDLLYKPGRRKVLQQYAAQPWIFRTPWFREHHEERAKLNLAREIRALS